MTGWDSWWAFRLFYAARALLAAFLVVLLFGVGGCCASAGPDPDPAPVPLSGSDDPLLGPSFEGGDGIISVTTR